MNSNMKVKMLVLKVASRCNLNCTYCYVYNLGDTSYKTQPKMMGDATVEALMFRVKEHCLAHNLDRFTFIFHGGEPLLLGKEFYYKFAAAAKRILQPEVDPIYCMQTNGTLITEDWCKALNELDINIGISIDGPKEVNDMFRVDHKGKGSYDKIIRGYNIAVNSEHIKMKPGLLSVININSDPLEVYNHFKQLKPRSVDFLFPEATFEKMPENKTNLTDTPYADWLIAIFDKWFHEKEKPFEIRLFETYMLAIFGISTGLDILGDYDNEVLVIEADGSIEPIGSLKICGEGFTKVGANILTHSFDEALQTKLATLYHQSGKMLCSTCQKCPIKKVCGAGYLPHRFSEKNGFDNPSVYCSDLMKLITYIQNNLIDSMPIEITSKLPITRLTYTQLQDYMRPFANLHNTEHINELLYDK
jgi:uncharacterized protein